MARLHTSFNRLAFFAWVFVAALGAANVSGRVDAIPEGSGRNLTDVVVWLEPAQGMVALRTVSSQHAILLQKNKTFTPHVLAVSSGTTVDFPNADPIFHSAFSNYDGQLFDLALYPPGTTRSVRFRRAGVVRVFCNIHPSMSAVILVLETSYFTHAQKDGKYRLTNVPMGEYSLHVFDERATAPPPPVAVQITTGDIRIPGIQISEAGYVQRPHKNKYGGDYPPESQREGYNDVLK